VGLNAGPANVFISCGQASDAEKAIAHEVAARLERMGFKPYVAVEVHDLRGLANNIYAQLDASEYFLFIDFKREYLLDERKGPPDSAAPKVYRGSLFTNQELAIASYMGLDPVVLQEDGIRRDGILNAIQANCIGFSDRRHVPAVAEDAVRQQGWDPTNRNLLMLSRDARESTRAIEITGRRKTFYHLDVKNLHRSRAATNCHVYLRSIRHVSANRDLEVRTVEMKWEGVLSTPYVTIGPKSTRSVDVLFAYDDKPGAAFAPAFTDSERLMPKFEGPGEWDLSVGVLAANFPEVTIDLRLRIAGSDVLLWDVRERAPVPPTGSLLDARVVAPPVGTGNYPRSAIDDIPERNLETPGQQVSS